MHAGKYDTLMTWPHIQKSKAKQNPTGKKCHIRCLNVFLYKILDSDNLNAARWFPFFTAAVFLTAGAVRTEWAGETEIPAYNYDFNWFAGTHSIEHLNKCSQ